VDDAEPDMNKPEELDSATDRPAPPWKLGIPFAMGAVILFVGWLIGRQPTALLGVCILVPWGAL